MQEDKQDEIPYAHCCMCGCEIYIGEQYYEMAFGETHIDCVSDYAKQYMKDNLKIAKVFEW